MKKLVLIFSIAVLGVFSTESYAQNIKPVMNGEEINNLVNEVHDSLPDNFLLKKLNGQDNRGFRIVFVNGDRHYTFDHNWHVEGIQIWVRPDGTHSPSLTDALSDENVDGVVDAGTNGDDKIFHSAGFVFDNSEAKGTQHKPYWQEIYNKALLALKETLN